MLYIKYYWIMYIYCTSAGIFSMFLFLHRQCESAKNWAQGDFEPPPDREYDFIVVGGGTAGSIVAGRLAQSSKYTVLLIEAGGGSSFFHDIPLSAPLIQKSPYDWQYHTIPQDNACLGMVNNISCWPMGKIMGGTSRLNYMIYLRGHEKDYESWSHGQDWTIPDVLYYFKRSENHQGIFKEYTKYHGTDGPIYVSDLRFTTDLGKHLIGAANELGYPTVDLNTMRSSPGVMEVQVTGYNGARWSSEHGLRKLAHNSSSNLHILTYTEVEKVLLRNGFEAYGVSFNRFGTPGKAFAKKSVILAAGAIGTAKILMLSGVGPKKHLMEHKIEPLIDLPVGENLQDHVTTGPDLVLLNHTLPISELAVLKTPIHAMDYLVNGNGLMTYPGCEFIGLFHTDNNSLPDLQIMALPAGISTDAGVVINNDMCISKKLWEEYFYPLVGRQQAVTILPTLLHPKSRGYVRLRSSDPKDYPIIDPKYFSNKDDIKVLTRGIKLIKKLVETKSMSKIKAHMNEKMLPGCEKYNYGSDLYWECYLRHLTVTAYHPVGSCKMGRDEESVVDYDLSVHKTNKLHIIDASIMPTMPSANINAAVLMIAEKGVDILKYKLHTHFHKCQIRDIFMKTDSTPRRI